MAVDLGAARERLLDGKFSELFVDVLGWYPPAEGRTVVRPPAVSFQSVAECAGFPVFLFRPGRKVHVPASIQSRLAREAAGTLDCDCMVVWPSEDFGESLWQGYVRDNPDLPAYRLSHRELSGRMRRILDALCFWGCNPLHFSASAVSSLLEQALAPATADWGRATSRRAPRRRRLFEDGHFVPDSELATVARVGGEGPPRALLTPVPLETAYSPANGNQRRFSNGYLHADFLESPDVEQSQEGLHTQLTRALNGALSPRERNLLTLRFGLDGGGSRTLEQVGKGLSVTRERVRQIEARALRRLRRPAWSRPLASYLSDSRPLESPWPEFWQTARGRRLGTYRSRAERRLAEFEARSAPDGGWTEEETIDRAEYHARLTKAVRWELDEEQTERPRGDVVLRGAAGAIRLTDVRLRAVSEFRRVLTAHRPAPEVARVLRTPPEPCNDRAGEWSAIRAVTTWIETGTSPVWGGQAELSNTLLREMSLRLAVALIQLCGFTVHDRRLDDRALWVHDPAMQLRLDRLAAVGLRFTSGSHRYEGGWVRGWWFK